MSSFGLIKDSDLVDNPAPRVAICLCIDTSYSMKAVIDSSRTRSTGRTIEKDGKRWNLVEGECTTRIDELQRAIESFFKSLRNDTNARFSAEVSVVTFSDTAECILDFGSLDSQPPMPDLEADGETAMGEGVNLALDLLEKRKSQYQSAGIDYYQPWIVIMSDGSPTGSRSELERAKQRLKKLSDERKITIFPLGIGTDADLSVLSELSPKRPPLLFRNCRFEDFFQWLSQSVSRVSASRPGEEVKLPSPPNGGWDSL